MNHREEGYLSKVAEAAGPSGVQIIIEMAAHTNLAKDLEVCYVPVLNLNWVCNVPELQLIGVC